MDAIDAYCVKCKSKVVIKEPEEVKIQNGGLQSVESVPNVGQKYLGSNQRQTNNPRSLSENNK